VPGLPGKYRITLKSQWVSGEGQDGHFGLFLGWDDDNFYLFGLTPENYSSVGLRKNDTWMKRPISNKNILGVDKSDVTISVEVRDKQATYYLDDSKVGQLTLKDFDVRRIGVYVGGKQKVEFDSLVVESSN
jgi:hypothetical protein